MATLSGPCGHADGPLWPRCWARYLFLFDKAVIVCKRRGDSYELKEIIELLFHKMTDDPMNNKDVKKVSPGFPVVTEGLLGWAARCGAGTDPPRGRSCGVARESVVRWAGLHPLCAGPGTAPPPAAFCLSLSWRGSEGHDPDRSPPVRTLR